MTEQNLWMHGAAAVTADPGQFYDLATNHQAIRALADSDSGRALPGGIVCPISGQGSFRIAAMTIAIFALLDRKPVAADLQIGLLSVKPRPVRRRSRRPSRPVC